VKADSSERELAEQLWAEWKSGASKKQIEIRIWDDATSNGRHFDRFVETTLGVSTRKQSKQSSQIEDLQRQVRRLGQVPINDDSVQEWIPQLLHARNSALAALRVWNDPTAGFRTETFALLFATAWNALCSAILQQAGKDWIARDDEGNIAQINGRDRSKEILDLVGDALASGDDRGTRENIRYWVELRNQVAHRHLPALDAVVIPYAQAGLLNFENVLITHFGPDYQLGESLSVPLQLSGFRDPGVLSSLKRLQASLPLDVQTFLSKMTEETEDLLTDPTYVLRVAFLPVVPSSGRNPDAVAYFVRPGELAPELESALDTHLVVSKVVRPERPQLIATQVVKAVAERIPFRFTTNMHTAATYNLRVRIKGGPLEKCDPTYCEFVSSVNRHLYNQAWVDRLVRDLSDATRFAVVTGVGAVPGTER
jgi:hypothetical protein